MSIKRQRELSKFDEMRDGISPLVAKGDPLSLLKAQQVLRATTARPGQKVVQKHNWMTKIGEQVKARLEAQKKEGLRGLDQPAENPGYKPLESGPRPGVPRGVAEAFPETATEKVYGKEGTLDEPGRAVAGALNIADTPRRVVGGILASGKPGSGLPFADLPGNVRTAITDPNSFRSIDAKPIQALPDRGLEAGPLNITPKTVAGFGLDVATDPTNLLGVGSIKSLTGRGGIKAVDDPVAARVAQAVQQKFRPGAQGVPMGGGASMMSPTIKGTRGPVAIGDSGIKDAIERKALALNRPENPITYGAEGSKRRAIVGSIFNPSANMPQEVHVANNARIGVQNSLYTDFIRTEQAAAREVKAAFAESPPTYIGADRSRAVDTAADFLERPSSYDNASPRLEAAKDAWGQAQLDNLNRVRAQYKGDVEPFTGSDPRGVYVSHVASEDDLDKAVQATSRSLSSRTSLSKDRAYETLHDRMKTRPDFNPELDLEKLADNHANSLAFMAANNTFKEGVGGQTRAQLMEQLHPKLFTRMTNLRQRLQGLRGTAGRLDARTDTAIGDFLASAQDPADLDSLLANLEPTVGPYRGQPGVNFGMNEAQVNAEIKQVRDSIRQLKPSWEAADTGDFVLNQKTFRYHTPEQAKAIDSVLKTKVDNAFIEGALSFADELRIAQLGPDFSPLTIQGALGALSHPEVLIKDSAVMAKIAFGGDDALRQAVNPESVRRYEFATGRSFGNVGQEFRQAGRGFERLPVVGTKIGKFNDALQRVVEYGNLKAWENDTAILQKFGTPQNIADHEAANSLSKFLPRLNPAETGRSVQRARLERIPFISTSFKYAPPLIAKDIMSGVGKLATASVKGGFNEKAAWQSLDGREQLALIRGTALATTWMSVATASALASADANGLDPVDAVKQVVDPRSKRFGHIIMGNKGSVGLGGPIRSFIRGVAPRYVDGKMVPFAGLVGWATSSLPNSLRVPVDLIRNEDFQGNRIVEGDFPENFLRALEYGVESLNLITGSAIEPLRTGEVPLPNSLSDVPGTLGRLAPDVASQILGTNRSPITPTDKLDEIARKLHGSGFYDLTAPQQDKIKKANPDVWAQAVKRGSPERQAGEKVKIEHLAKQEARDADLLAGRLTRDEYVNAYYDALTEKRAKMEQIYGSEPITKPKDPMEKYIQILQQAEDPKTGILDRDKVDAGMARLTKTDEAFIDEAVGLGDTAITAVFRDVRETRRARNELPKYRGFTADQAEDIDEVWQEVRNNAKSADRLDMLKALRYYLATTDSLDGATIAGVRKRINGRLRTLSARANFDKANPSQRVFYGSGKLTQQEIAFLTKQKEAA